jgi:hypothetical protein
MCQLLERQPIQSQSAVTAAYDPDHRILDVEYFNGLVYRFFNVSPDVGTALFEGSRFDEVLQKQVVKRRDYKLVDNPQSMLLKWLKSILRAASRQTG